MIDAAMRLLIRILESSSFLGNFPPRAPRLWHRSCRGLGRRTLMVTYRLTRDKVNAISLHLENLLSRLIDSH